MYILNIALFITTLKTSKSCTLKSNIENKWQILNPIIKTKKISCDKSPMNINETF